MKNAKPTFPQSTADLLSSTFPGESEMSQRMRDYDWSKTCLGSVDTWSQSLRTSVSICVNSRFPTVIYWGEEFALIYNDGYAPILGQKHPWAIGRPVEEVWSEIWSVNGPMLKGVMASGVPTWSEDRLLSLNRKGFLEETYFTYSFAPIMSEAGKVGGIFCSCTETTNRILAERRLRFLRELGAKATDAKTSEDACKISGAAMNTQTPDITFALIYLLDQEAKTASLCVDKENLKIPSQLAPESIALNDPHAAWPLSTVMNTKTYEVVNNTFVYPISRSDEDPPYGFLIAGVSPSLTLDDDYKSFLQLVAGQVAMVISSARAYQEERRRAEGLAEIDRAKTTFFSNVSHEFRTPLTLMLGPLEDVLREDLSMACRDQLTMAHHNALRLLKLVNTLLSFARIESDRLEVFYEPTDLSTLTSDLASSFRSAMEKAGLKLTVQCSPLPEPIFIDRGMWEKIVLNLLSNAFKFTFEGEVAISLSWLGSHVELNIRDSGVGIPAEEIPRMFDRFHRIPNSKSRTHEGSGIGLALVKELVKYHYGSIDVHSVLGKGTTFVIQIPTGSKHLPAEKIRQTKNHQVALADTTQYVQEALSWLPRENDMQATQTALPSHKDQGVAPDPSIRILVADDNADMRQYLTNLLSTRWVVDVAENGETALKAAMVRPPNLVLSDVMMPGIDGFEVVRRLRADQKTKDIPIILLSARAGEESRVEGVAKGADDYLVKPFSARELMARVQTHLQLSQQRREATRVIQEAKDQLQRVNEELERRVAERTADLVKEKVKLERSNKELDQFAAVAAHDLRAPVKSMRNWIEMLDHMLPKPHNADINQACEFIHRSAVKAEALINDLLGVARVNISHASLEKIDLNKTIEHLKMTLKDEIERSGTNINNDRLPEVWGHAIYLESVFSNLIRNAILYRDANRSPEIVIGLTEQQDQYQFFVKDNGMGIESEHTGKIFEMFKRLHHEKEYPGSGIGLAYCKKVLEKCGGKIWVNSVPGEGSTFLFTYPKNEWGPRHVK